MTSTVSNNHVAGGRRTTLAVAAGLLVAMLGALVLMGWNVTVSPFQYHPDDRGKVVQLAERDWNFRHPQLLMRGAEAANVALSGTWQWTSESLQRITKRGRFASVGFAAAAAGLLGWLAYRHHGPAAAFAAFAVVATGPNLIVNAHYLKEDAALLFGVTAWLLGASWFLRDRTWAALAAMAVGGGLAATGKFVGAPLAIASVVLAALWPPVMNHAAHPAEASEPARSSRPRIAAGVAALCVAAAVYALVNLPILFAFDKLIAAIRHVGRYVGGTGHSDGLLYRPPELIARQLLRWPNAMLLALAAVDVGFTLASRQRRREPWRWLVPGVAILFPVMLSFSDFFHPRHLLPTEALIGWMGACGAVTLAGLVARRPAVRVALAALLLAAPLASQLRHDLRFNGQLGNDSRIALRAWFQENVPSGTRVVMQDYAFTPGLTNIERIIWPERGSVADFAAEGIEFAAIADMSYGRYFTPGIDPDPRHLEQVRRERQILADLAADHELVWRYDNPVPVPQRYGYASPSLRIYRLHGATTRPDG